MLLEKELRFAFSHFATGVTIVAVLKDKPYGLTVNSFTSVSLDPPLVLICIKKGKKSHEYIADSDFFCVNILAEDQEWLSVRFADPSIEETRFEGIKYELDEFKCPNIEGCIYYITCEKYKEYDGGDHTIFLGKVVKLKSGRDKNPLIFFKSKYKKLKN